MSIENMLNTYTWEIVRDVQLAYLISDHENKPNRPIYAVEQDLGSWILHINYIVIGNIPILNKTKTRIDKNQNDAQNMENVF